jgi:hypothetical protein
MLQSSGFVFRMLFSWFGIIPNHIGILYHAARECKRKTRQFRPFLEIRHMGRNGRLAGLLNHLGEGGCQKGSQLP